MSGSNFLSQVRPADVLRDAIEFHLRYTFVRSGETIIPAEMLAPLSLAIRDQLVDRMLETDQRYRQTDAKRLYYLSMEFLMGRLLGDTMCNLRLHELTRQVLAERNINLDDVLETEPDAGLGNGGLGRLAACFLESLATLDMPGFGYGIDYEYGLFRQEIANGFQREKPDRWKAGGTPFLIPRTEESVVIPLYGRVEYARDPEANFHQQWLDQKVVIGVPSDVPVAGYNGNTVNFPATVVAATAVAP